MGLQPSRNAAATPFSTQPSGLGHLGDSSALFAWPRSPWISALHLRLGESPNGLQQMASYFRDRTLKISSILRLQPL